MQEVQVQLYQSEFSVVLSRAKLISSCFLMLEAAVTRLASVCEDQQSGRLCVEVGRERRGGGRWEYT